MAPNRRIHRTATNRCGPAMRSVEAIEKVPEQIPGRDAEESKLQGCTPIDDLMLGKGEMTPPNSFVTCQGDFSDSLVRR
jgi:hypothetical protein